MTLGFMSLVSLLSLIFWIWMLVHCLLNPKLRDVQRLTWALVILFLNVIGAAIYFAVGRNPRT